MSDHVHDWWRSQSGTLVCDCGQSRHPVEPGETMEAIAPFVAQQARPPRREEEVRASGWSNL